MSQRKQKKKLPFRHPQRRGIVLLIVISILVLFMLMLVTFAVVTSHYRQAAQSFSMRNYYGEDPREESDTILHYVLSGPAQPYSSLYGVDLLGDLYGNDGLKGTVSANATVEGPFLRFSFNTETGFTASNIENTYAGNVISFIDGPCAGMSTRVTFSTNTMLRIEPCTADDGSQPFPQNGNRFIINGKPFNGTGLGKDPAKPYSNDYAYDHDNDTNTPGLPYALMPHMAGWGDVALAATASQGGLDEPWDTFCYQNPFLAMVPADAATNNNAPIFPSYHRPDLLTYWNTATGFSTNIKRAVLFRPLSEDHPNFPANNNLQNSTATWDVDNDGDGRTDSIWIDPGLPALTAANGKKYKRLVALMIRDLDGRIHVNAHGSTAFLEPTYRPQTNITSNALAGSTTSVQLPRGLGYGPAEINFLNLFLDSSGSNITNATTQYQTLLQGTADINGRYGRDNTATIGNRVAGYVGQTSSVTNDPLSAVKTQGYPYNYGTDTFNSIYANKPDAWGRGAIALDKAGQPLQINMGQNGEFIDNPYEMNLGDPNPQGDTPYSVAELERVLRQYDHDANMLPDRLFTALDLTGTNTSTTSRNKASNARAHLVTTVSSHVPTPGGAVPRALRGNTGNALEGNHILALAYKKCNNNMNLVKQIMPFEFFRGEKFDLNRPFGNGVDDNGNGIVDEPSEAVADNIDNNGDMAMAIDEPAEVPATYHSWTQGNFNGQTRPYPGNDDPAGLNERLYPREIYARHLYCLMLLLMNENYSDQITQTNGSPNASDLFKRKIAQWAVNAVDYRDPDAIMTKFEYDENPWDGWSPTPGRRVWGMEFQEFCMTESLAFHDRGLKDTAHHNLQKKRLGSDNKIDLAVTSLSQYRIPQGSLFIEFKSNRSHYDAALNGNEANIRFPAELYAGRRLDIGKLAPARTVGSTANVRHPVWRVLVTKKPDRVAGDSVSLYDYAKDRTNTNTFTLSDLGLNPATDVERCFWFSNITPNPNGHLEESESNRIYYGRTNNFTIEPGRYFVMGPRAVTPVGALKLGTDGDVDTYDPSPNAFEINGTTFTTVGSVGNTAYTPYPPNANIRDNVPALICAADPPAAWSLNYPIGINISEPLPQDGYYREPIAMNGTYADLKQPYDAATNYVDLSEYDKSNTYKSKLLASDQLVRTGTQIDPFRVLLLQRLADPTVPWNPEEGKTNYDNSLPVNPYITVDGLDVDLTVFNGQEVESKQYISTTPGDTTADDWHDPSDATPYGGAEPKERFAAREKGLKSVINPLPSRDTFYWTYRSTAPAQSDAQIVGADAVDHYFKHTPKHTLGYLNESMGTPQADATNIAYTGTASEGPIPYLQWNNRPYANPLELMCVPCTSNARLGWEFLYYNGTQFDNTKVVNPYLQLAGNGRNERGYLAYQLNFFLSSNDTVFGADAYKIFDYVETRSPYAGTERWYTPTDTNTGVGGTNYRPPFNRLSRFRDPGRVNINTIVDAEVWDAITSGLTTTADMQNAKWNDLVNSRRGLASGSPSNFANPFRPADAFDLMPRDNLKPQRPVDATLLRATTNDGPTPLFGSPDYTEQYRNTDRNAFFKYQPFSKLSNMVTTNSNCYAVWMTIGYFEVEQGSVDVGHPDGYRLGQELGLDDGTAQRHRAFYILDRSIPVAYEPGHVHNIDRCVLLRRFIE